VSGPNEAETWQVLRLEWWFAAKLLPADVRRRNGGEFETKGAEAPRFAPNALMQL
jgi:hypothetical protein